MFLNIRLYFVLILVGLAASSYAQKTNATKVAKSTANSVGRELGNDISKDTTSIRNNVKQQANIKKDITAYKNSLSIPKFSEIKVDTGDIPLEKEGLMLRGKGVLKSNSGGISKPNTFSKSDPWLNKSKWEIGNNKTLDSIKQLKLDRNFVNQGSKTAFTSLKKSDNGAIGKVRTATHTVDSVVELADRNLLSKGSIQQVLVKKIYSEKHLKKMYDSLGFEKADSIYKIAAPLLKKEISKEQFIQTLNHKIAGNTKVAGSDYNATDESLPTGDFDKLNGLPNEFHKADLSKMQLPPEIASELPPLRSNLIDNKYLDEIGNLRKANLKSDRLKLKEEQVTDKIKSTVIEKKPGFFDKSYTECIIGYLQSGGIKLYQASPSFAYHITRTLSMGAGPNVLAKAEEHKKLRVLVGFRYYSKLELFKQRGYLQVEDNMNPSVVSTETMQFKTHSLLAGGGVLLPISKKLALNPCVLYKVINDGQGGSPWVFRLGLSSIKLKN